MKRQLKKHIFQNLHFTCMKRHVLAWHFRCGHKVLLGEETFKWIFLLKCHPARFPVYLFFQFGGIWNYSFCIRPVDLKNDTKKKCGFHCKNCAFGEHLSKHAISSRQNPSLATDDDTCLPELFFSNTSYERILYCFRAGLV